MKKVLRFAILLTLIFAVSSSISLYARTRNIKSFDQIQKIRLLGANNVPVKLIVVLQPAKNGEFVKSLVKLVIKIHKEDPITKKNPFKLHIVPADASNANDFAIIKEAFKPEVLKKYVEFNKDYHTGGDIWMQDWGEVGTVKLKNQKKPQLLVLDSNRGRGNSKLPILLSKFWNSFYMINPSNAHSCGDYGGNIEVTPDNILVMGNTSTEKFRNFFATHGYKGRLAIVETDWLLVGHCDEYISIAPNPKSRTGYSIIKANPRLALRLIKKASREELKNIPDKKYSKKLLAVHDYLVKSKRENMNFSIRNGQNADLKSIPQPLASIVDSIDSDGNIPPMSLSFDIGDFYKKPEDKEEVTSNEAEEFIKTNLALATLIDSNIKIITDRIAKVRKETGRKYSVISFPVMYHKYKRKHIAYVPGTVNQLILNRNLVIPDPLIESFRLYISRTTSKLGLKAHFLNDMMYHTLEGEIHCGTNVFRHPNKYFVRPR